MAGKNSLKTGGKTSYHICARRRREILFQNCVGGIFRVLDEAEVGKSIQQGGVEAAEVDDLFCYYVLNFQRIFGG